MLQKLYIKNYAIIDELTIDFDTHLNVITGETGAGKSIILGALSLILGERADTSVLINTQEKCVVEALFNTQHNISLQLLFQQNDLDIEPTTIIRREINTAGKSRAFVNDTPVTLSVLNQITSTLVDLHRQFDNRALDENSFMYATIDAMIGHQKDVSQYQQALQVLRKSQNEYNNLEKKLIDWQKEADYNQFLFDELEQANFTENEIEEAEIALKQLAHSEQIKTNLSTAYTTLSEGEYPINNELKKIIQQLQQIENVFPAIEPLTQRMNSAYEELKDIAGEMNNLQNDFDIDAEHLETLEQRVDLGNRLLKKHNVLSTKELQNIQAALSEQLQDQNNAGEQLEILKKQIDQDQATLELLSHALYEKRNSIAPEFSADINKLLKLIGMPNATLKIKVSQAEQFHAFGKDELSFLLDANKSGKFSTIQKAASGGELSRIMLSIKTLTAKALSLPTLIFDEVDTGISGEAARQVGILLQEIGQYHQVICITHQPQIAAKGERHFYVYKIEEDGKITTQVKVLEQQERVQHIAEMIGGERPSAAAINNARELMNS